MYLLGKELGHVKQALLHPMQPPTTLEDCGGAAPYQNDVHLCAKM